MQEGDGGDGVSGDLLEDSSLRSVARFESLSLSVPAACSLGAVRAIAAEPSEQAICASNAT